VIYTAAVLDHFLSPRNVGEIPDADGVGRVGDPACGDVLVMWIKVHGGRIEEVRFKCSGCPAAIATSSVTTELALGKHVDVAAAITEQMITDALDGLPDEKLHCSVLGAAAIRRAIDDYRGRRQVSDVG
jgi:nitrogen fixation NifU-like protein